MPTAAPLELHRDTVKPEWIDYNGHMNVAYYVLVFDHATDAFLAHVGLDQEHLKATGGSTFAVESHVTYAREVRAGDPLKVTTQLLAHDAKRLHFFHRMYHAEAGFQAATSEWLNLYVDLNARRVVEMPAAIQRTLAEVQAAHDALGWPEEAGRTIRVGRKVAG